MNAGTRIRDRGAGKEVMGDKLETDRAEAPKPMKRAPKVALRSMRPAMGEGISRAPGEAGRRRRKDGQGRWGPGT